MTFSDLASQDAHVLDFRIELMRFRHYSYPPAWMASSRPVLNPDIDGWCRAHLGTYGLYRKPGAVMIGFDEASDLLAFAARWL